MQNKRGWPEGEGIWRISLAGLSKSWPYSKMRFVIFFFSCKLQSATTYGNYSILISPMFHRALSFIHPFQILKTQGYKYEGLLAVSSEDTTVHCGFPRFYKIAHLIFIYKQPRTADYPNKLCENRAVFC